MGGEETGVQDDTTEVFLEVAYFTPIIGGIFGQTDFSGRLRCRRFHLQSGRRFGRGRQTQVFVVIVFVCVQIDGCNADGQHDRQIQ